MKQKEKRLYSEMRRDVMKAIHAFERATGYVVEEIWLDRVDVLDGSGPAHRVRTVRADVLRPANEDEVSHSDDE